MTPSGQSRGTKLRSARPPRLHAKPRFRPDAYVATNDEQFVTLGKGMLPNLAGTVLAVLVILWLALRSAHTNLAVFVSLCAREQINSSGLHFLPRCSDIVRGPGQVLDHFLPGCAAPMGLILDTYEANGLNFPPIKKA
jgi:hypothetical protein